MMDQNLFDNQKELEQSRDVTAINRAIKRIADSLLRGDNSIQFLFGAGMSVESNAPTSRDVSMHLLSEFFPDDFEQIPADRKEELINEYPFEAYISAIEKTYNKRDDLTKILNELITPSNLTIHQGHIDLVGICDFSKPPLLNRIYTTNFDQLIEEAFGKARAKKITNRNPEEIRDLEKKGKIPVIHLHGTLDEDDYQITEDDLWKDNFNILHQEFEISLNMDVLVFVGYSMNDPDFRDIYLKYKNKMVSRDSSKGKWTYIVSPTKDKFSYLLGKDVWLTRQAHLIPLTASDFFARLKNRIELNIEENIAETVKKYHDLEKNEKKFNQLLIDTANTLKCDNRVALLYLYRQIKLFEGV